VDESKVANWLEKAADVTDFIGFAAGRTSFLRCGRLLPGKKGNTARRLRSHRQALA
jgi:hypothetical protein